MIRFKLPAKISRGIGMLLLKAKAYAPEICVISGFGLGAASLVTVGVKTWKHKDKLVEDKKRLDAAKGMKKSKNIVILEDGTKKETVIKRELTKEEKKELWGARFDLGIDSIKTYILPVGEAALGGFLIWKGRGILRDRLSMATAQVAALSAMNAKLLKQIEEKHGAEEAKEMVYKMDEDGKIDQDDIQASGPRSFSFVFGCGIWNKEKQEWYHKNYKWSRSKIDNQYLVSSNQRAVRDKINVLQNWIYYGEIVEMFGCPTEPWMYNWIILKEDDKDVYVDFHVLDSDQQLECNKRFMDINDPTNACIIQVDNVQSLDEVFKNPEKYDKRFGKRPKKMPTVDELMSAEYSKELAEGGCYV